VNQYQAGKLASQHRAELLVLAAHHDDARQARAAGRARTAHQTQAAPNAQAGRQARAARQAGEVLATRAQRHRIRRRAGWALVALGLRLAYAAGED